MSRGRRKSNGPPTAIFYFSSRDIRDDFRHPLVEAWRRLGIPTHFIRVGRRPRVSSGHCSDRPRELSPAALPFFVRKVVGRGARPVYFDTTCLAFPWAMAAIRLTLPPGLWCYDLHDDYVYFANGWRKGLRSLQQFVLTRTSDVTVHAAPNLREIAPRAVHLGNASDLRPITREPEDFSRLLISGSIDERCDFELVARVAALAPELSIDLWGHVAENRREPAKNLAELLRQCGNVRHFGHYAPDELPAILARYSVSFAPYRRQVRSTHYIDPLRFYYCLNSGIEVISTDIPAVGQFAGAVHVASSADQVVAIWRRLAHPEARRNRAENYTAITWDQRAAEVLSRL